MWSVDYEYIRAWLDDQDIDTVKYIFAALKRLEQQGPMLGRPLLTHSKGRK